MSSQVGSKVLSPAKLNLGLRVVGRREDGYHLLESLFWPIDLVDEIFLEPCNNNEVTMEWHPEAPSKTVLPSQENNTIFRLLSGIPKVGKWKVHVKKRIPVGGGLGGSSSNAGTVLREFVKRGLLTLEEASTLALKTGADVPFFLDPVPTWVTGVGEERRRIEFSPEALALQFHLVFFSEPCITSEVFGAYRKSNAKFSLKSDGVSQGSFKSLKKFLSGTANDLEGGVCATRQDIAKALDYLKSLNFLYVGMSGSGSTCFGVSVGDAVGNNISKDLQQFCRKSNCRSIKVNTFR